jgi:hypothetical protein
LTAQAIYLTPWLYSATVNVLVFDNLNKKGGNRMRKAVWFIAALFLAAPAMAPAEHKTIDELAKAYSVEKCKSCHGKVHEEWQSSYHSQSIVHSLGGIRNYIVIGLGQEWKTQTRRT